MSSNLHNALFPLVAIAATTGCDVQQLSLREAMLAQAEAATISLQEAIESAQAEMPGAVVIEAELDVDDDHVRYEVELFADGIETEIHIDPDTGAIIESKTEALDPDDRAEAQAAADLVAQGPGWAALIAAATTAANGHPIEVKAQPEHGGFEVELVADVIWEVDLRTDGSVAKVEVEDDEQFESEEESENDDDDDDDDDTDDDTEDDSGGDDADDDDADDDDDA